MLLNLFINSLELEVRWSSFLMTTNYSGDWEGIQKDPSKLGEWGLK